MSKLTKNASILADLQARMNEKQASVKPQEVAKTETPAPEATEKAAVEAVKTETTPAPTVDQNNVKPEALNDKQTPEQKKSPVDVIKKKADEATEVNPDLKKVADELLAMVDKMAKAQITPISPAINPTPAPTVDQNAVKPEALNDKQKPVQKPATHPSTPVKTSEEADKTASFELGKMIAELAVKQAAEQELNLYKQAGRRDFEMLVNMATQAIEQQQPQQKQAAVDEAAIEKEAEEAGREAFRNLMKQAQAEYAANQVASENAQLKEKVAALEKAQQEEMAALKKQAADEAAKYQALINEQKEIEKFANLSEAITSNVLSRLKSELLSKQH